MACRNMRQVPRKSSDLFFNLVAVGVSAAKNLNSQRRGERNWMTGRVAAQKDILKLFVPTCRARSREGEKLVYEN